MEQEKIGKFIKKLRKENNLTQKDLADKYGVTYQAVSKWETGKNIPDISLLKEISKDFNVNIETDNTDVAKIYIDGTLQDGTKTYNLSKTVAIQGSTITNFENLLDEYYTEINM